MAEGTIVELRRSFGFIRPSRGGDQVFFHRSALDGVRFNDLREGMAVEYEMEQGDKGPRATVVGLSGTQDEAAYRFLNPYNFVRPLDKPRPKNHMLGECPPPPHDRYVDGLLTGRITCEVTAVTPLFISDSHGIEGGVGEHRSFHFFEYEGQPAIPASSLRGMIRSIFETVTNSCFAVFGGQRLSYRLEAGRATALVPARVEKRQDGTWHLRLLTGFVPLNPGRRPKGLYAATVHLYDPIQGKRIRTPKVSLDGFKHGDPCYALVEKKGIFTYVLQVGHTRKALPQPSRHSQRVVSGWLCINNQNVENKRKERFFFRDPGNSVGPTQIPLPAPVRNAYEDLIADYQTRHEDVVKARRRAKQPLDRPVGHGRKREPALSRYMYRNADLRFGDGTLVYVGLSGTTARLQVEYIAPAAVPRVSYDHSIADLLSSHLHPCEKYEALCPGCRVFGWVYRAQPDEKIPLEKITAYAGRLRFSHATLLEDRGTLEDITLAILSSPKPTTTRFYLRPASGKPRDGQSDAEAGYDGDNILRGRKFYRYHGEVNPAEYNRVTTDEFDGKDSQNRTVHGARRPGNKFRFTIDFHNLAPVELGALLWVLELREGDRHGYHRLGFAKPLGFGSVELGVIALELVDPVGRYKSLETDGGWRGGLAQKAAWTDGFRQAMETLYNQPLSALPNVRDLLVLLGESSGLPIHYPRVDRTPSPEGKNFDWFVGNKRSGRDAGPRLALRLADEDTEGLPLLDKYGRVRQA